MLYAYIDESGDLGKYSTPYFVVTILVTRRPYKLEQIIKKTRQRKLKKKLKEISELKAQNALPIVRRFILKKISSLECEIHAIVVNKEKMEDILFLHKLKLYTRIVSTLIEETELGNDDIEVVIDKREGKQVVRDAFSFQISKTLAQKNPNHNITILHKDSQNCKGIQAVDFVAWAIHRKYSFKNEDYYAIIQPKIKTLKLV